MNETYNQYYNKQHEWIKSYEHNYQDILNRESFYEDEQPNESDYQYFNEQQQQINQEFHDKQVRDDNDFFNKFDKNEYKQINSLDELARINSQNKFDNQLKKEKLENAIKRAYEAVDNAIKLIKQYNKEENLKKIEQKEIHDKSHLLEYYIPENEELYEYLDKFNNKFKSKHNDYLMINEPHDFDKAVEVWDYYTKYDKDYVDKEEYNGSPIVIYYFNQISSLNQIFESLQQVFDRELKPFKIHFQLSGVFETPVHDLA